MAIENAPDLLWRKLAGLFGADAVERKFGSSPPPEWTGLLRTVNDFELQRGLKRLAFSGRDHVPTLPAFLSLCRAVGHEADQNLPQRPAVSLPAAQSLRWDRQANDHLLAHVMRQAIKGIHYCCADTLSLKRNIARMGPSEESKALTQPLVECKNVWAQQMRELEDDGALPTDGGKSLWEECMANAEEMVARVRRANAA